MLLNYYTVGTCFISETWYNSNVGMYAGSLIGVFFLTMAIEGVRRLMREYDRRLVKTLPAAKTCNGAPWGSQVVRGILYGGQFTAAFIVYVHFPSRAVAQRYATDGVGCLWACISTCLFL
jgi:copper transporter 1